MQIILRGPAAGYEAEHTARLFFPGAEKSENLPQEGDFVLAQSHQCTDLALLRLNGKLQWQTALRPQGEDAEYALCRLLYGMLCRATGITPPWGMMTGVRPVRIIHDMRAAGAGEDEIRARFLDHFGRKSLRLRSALPTCKSRFWTLPTRWTAASMRASRSARPGAATAALSPARWGINPAVRLCSPMSISFVRS